MSLLFGAYKNTAKSSNTIIAESFFSPKCRDNPVRHVIARMVTGVKKNYQTGLKFAKRGLPPLHIPVVALGPNHAIDEFDCMIRSCRLYDLTLPFILFDKAEKEPWSRPSIRMNEMSDYFTTA